MTQEKMGNHRRSRDCGAQRSNKTVSDFKSLKWLAGEPGFEPGLTESESVGLPLTYSPTRRPRGTVDVVGL